MPPGTAYIMPGRAIIAFSEPIRVVREDALDEPFRNRVRDDVDRTVRELETDLVVEEPA
jgi:hypothetical protein